MRRGLEVMLQRNFLLRGWWGAGTVSPGKCECPTPGSVQGQSELGPNQPDGWWVAPLPMAGGWN